MSVNVEWTKLRADREGCLRPCHSWDTQYESVIKLLLTGVRLQIVTSTVLLPQQWQLLWRKVIIYAHPSLMETRCWSLPRRLMITRCLFAHLTHDIILTTIDLHHVLLG